MFPKAWADTVARLRVPGGFLLAGSFALLAEPTRETLLFGVPISIAGLMLRAWAAGHLAKNQNLATGGPYAYVRNPLYAGTLMVAAGLVVSSQRWELAVIFAAVFGLVYFPVIQNEEQHLANLFPRDFSAYRRHVPLLIPRFSTKPTTAASHFNSSLYLKNEEYNALIGYLIGLGWLIWRAWA